MKTCRTYKLIVNHNAGTPPVSSYIIRMQTRAFSPTLDRTLVCELRLLRNGEIL